MVNPRKQPFLDLGHKQMNFVKQHNTNESQILYASNTHEKTIITSMN